MTNEPQRERRPRVLAWMLLVSVALHGVAGVWLFAMKRPPEPRDLVPRAPLAMEILVTERHAPPKPPSPEPLPRPEPRRPETARKPVTSPQVAASAPPPTPSAPRVSEDVPRRGSDMPGADAPLPRGPVLTPSAEALAQTRAGDPEGLADPVPGELPEDAPGIQAPRRRTPQQLVQETVEDTLATSRARRGAVHPYFQLLGQALMDAWDPRLLIAKMGVETIAQRKGLPIKEWPQSWQKRAEVFGKTGSPLSDVKLAPMPRVLGGGVDLSSNFAPQVAMGTQLSADLERKQKMLMRLTQDRQGHLVSLYLVKPSALPEVDRDALEDIRASGSKLPTPPEEAVGPKTTLVSLWEVELSFGWNTQTQEMLGNYKARDVAFDFAQAIPGSPYFKHLRLAGAN